MLPEKPGRAYGRNRGCPKVRLVSGYDIIRPFPAGYGGDHGVLKTGNGEGQGGVNVPRQYGAEMYQRAETNDLFPGFLGVVKTPADDVRYDGINTNRP
jgi:hypothetical protein